MNQHAGPWTSPGPGTLTGRLAGFPAFVADQAPPLTRTAFLLTGDPMLARALVVASLTRIANRWASVRWASPAEAATAELFRRFVKRPPRPASRKSTPAPQNTTPAAAGGTAELSEALAALTPLRRALVVACLQTGVSPWKAAELCRRDSHTARLEFEAAVAELRRLEGRLAGTATPSPEPAGTPAQSPAAGSPGDAAGSTGPAEDREPQASAAGASAPGASPSADTGAPPPWISPTAQSAAAPWASPSAASGTPVTGSGPAPWASPSAEPGPAPSGSPFTTPGPAQAQRPPQTGSHQNPLAGSGFPGGTWEHELSRALATLSATMPPLYLPGLTGEIVRATRRHRTRRRLVVAGAVVAGTAAVITPFVLLVSAISDAAAGGPSAAEPYGPGGVYGYEDDNSDGETVPGHLPIYVGDPFQYAYQPYCRPDSESGENADACTTWRVVSNAAGEWRIPGADSRSGQALFAISSNGDRLAYYDTTADALVMRDKDATAPRVTDLVTDPDQVDYGTDLLFSPKGRWLAVDFGQDMGAPRPRLYDFTAERHWDLPPSLDVLAVAEDGTVTATVTEDTRKTPGRIHTTTLIRIRPDGHVLSRVRVEPELFDDGATLSDDGKTLAAVAWPAHPNIREHGMVVTLDPRTGKVRSAVEATLPEYMSIGRVLGWVDEHEVLVDASDDDEEYGSYIIDVTTGSAREAVESGSGAADVWAPGTLG
ncbi:hypothetical protein Pth03_15800 [Planotetraspora thailandica]|uniref:Uncharacterized protein n=1 Tax=Planotetraspora thailandica TaxID=487172 RepID=A0A8J3V188_9ACTN|nr:hypothetical protein [Planotetraspora thailandica]GII53191.1 hypothetical protein Pth03_15800 [Planotetraspora thailandica]